jgi:hypothetical protein
LIRSTRVIQKCDDEPEEQNDTVLMLITLLNSR